MSSMPSLSVRPLHDSGIPEGPKRIMNSPPTKKPPLDYYSGLPDINIFASAPGFGRGRGALPHEPAVAPQGPNCPWLSPLWRPPTFKSLRSFGVRPRPIFIAKTPKTKPPEVARSPCSNSRSRPRKDPASGSWDDHADDRCDRSHRGPIGVHPREATPEGRRDRRRKCRKTNRDGKAKRRFQRVPDPPPARQHHEPDARDRAELSPPPGLDASQDDLPHDALSAAARPGSPEAPTRVPFHARGVQGQASRDRGGRQETAPRAVHEPGRDLETPGFEVRGDPMKAIVASGKRKTAVARATLTKGRGVVRINSVPVEIYPFELGRLKILEPLKLAGKKVDSIDIDVNVQGGGVMGPPDPS